MSTPVTQDLFDAALRHHQAGRFAEAKNLYLKVLTIDPNDPGGLHGLGVVALHSGQYGSAVDLIGQAIRLNGKVAAFHYNLGLAFSRQKKPGEAAACFECALAIDPDFAEACSNLGNVLRERGQLDDAAAAFSRAIALRPGDVVAHNNLAGIFFAQRKFAEAAACCERALVLRPDDADTHFHLGNIFFEQGSLDEAAACFRRALALKPGHAGAYGNLGAVLYEQINPSDPAAQAARFVEQGKLDEAVACYRHVLALNPDDADTCNRLAAIFLKQDRLDEAAGCCDHALALGPGHAGAHSNRGAVFFKQGRHDEAVACYQRALAIDPDHAETHDRLGSALYNRNEYGSATESHARALRIRPDYLEARYHMSLCLGKLGRIDDALEALDRALAIDPDYAEAHHYKAYLQLLAGDFENGWRGHEWRWLTGDLRPHGFKGPLWDGKNLDGKTILLHCEQGLGDSIQFIRYAGMVKKKGGRVLLSCPANLARLFAGVKGIDEIFPDVRTVPAYDCRAPLLSLPLLFGTTPDTVPADVPYLRTEPERLRVWRGRLEALPGPRVGIAWRGNPVHKNDRNRSMAAALFSGFLDLEGIAVVSLQKDGRADEIADLSARGPFLDAGPLLNDLADTAACIANLDLVVSVDTSVCHLAGALGAPVWTLLPFAPDWRWLLAREHDSPWYPTMRLFRQPAPGDWQSVVSRVRAALRELASGKNRQPIT